MTINVSTNVTISSLDNGGILTVAHGDVIFSSSSLTGTIRSPYTVYCQDAYIDASVVLSINKLFFLGSYSSVNVPLNIPFYGAENAIVTFNAPYNLTSTLFVITGFTVKFNARTSIDTLTLKVEKNNRLIAKI